MALTTPLQALAGQDGSTDLGPLELVASAKANDSNAIEANLDPAWQFLGGQEIDGSRWNKSYPYQLLVVAKVASGYRRVFSFTLPIPPQEMSISMPFAINTSLTLGGVVEEHNGAPMRMISFSGTTGVLPLRGTGKTLTQSSLLGGIFAGTVNKFTNNLVPALQNLLGNSSQPNLADTDSDSLKASGYYQFRLLQRFLESYVTLKKQGHTDYRLALAIWKDQAIYLVTPQTFDVRRSSQSPHEYPYQLAFKAWRRIDSIDGAAATEIPNYKPVTRDPNKFANLLNKIQDARRVIQAGKETLTATVGDVGNDILETTRSVVFFCKDALSVPLTAADLPLNLARDLKASVLTAQGLKNIGSQISAGVSEEWDEAKAEFDSLAQEAGTSQTGSGQLSNTSAALDGAHVANSIFDHPEDHFEVMDQLKPSELDLPPALQSKISTERTRVRTMTRLDFEKARDQVLSATVSFADAVGAGSSTYTSTYRRPQASATRAATPDDFETLFALNQLSMELNRLAATSSARESVTTVDAVAGMASAAGIAFVKPVSKFAVPFPYGSTLEQLAAQYLGDPNRWHEIAVLNGLRQPFVDEEGFDLPLLTNGRDNQITVDDALNLFVGQLVWLSSSETSRTQRRITNIDQASDGMVLLTLDGDEDLDRFTVAGASTLHAFLPDTVNSQQLIYIPSDKEPSGDDFLTKAIPGLNEYDSLIAIGGVDLLLTQDNDLVITDDGDNPLAIGLTNIVQQVRVAISTPRGSLLHHLSYGFGISAGMSTADVDAKTVLEGLQSMFGGDPTFSGVSSVAISKVGPALRIAMSVGIAGLNQTIPVSVDIKQ
jgi:hypothetical protein